MEFNMEWDVICRICLQEGEMSSIYERDEKNIPYADKIMRCSNINIKPGVCLPEQICKRCTEDLNVAYRFRLNCESSDAILQSLVAKNTATDLIMTVKNGELYQYRPPHGLDVKRLKPVLLKVEPTIETEISHTSSLMEEHHFASDDSEETMCEEILPDSIVTSSQAEEFQDVMKTEEIITLDLSADPQAAEEFFATEEKPAIDSRESETNIDFEQTKDIVAYKTVKTNKARIKKTTEKTNAGKVVSTQIGSPKNQEGPGFRVRKNCDEQKPLKICEICGNTYKYKHALESHMRRHRNEKPFSCEICQRSFVINFELRRHMRTHTGQKPYACRYCDRRFSDFGSRIKHERTHTGERPYKCETCGKAFAYSHVLTSHILTHTGEKRYLCGQCGKRFTKAHHLKAHMNTHFKNQNNKAMLRSIVKVGVNQITLEVDPAAVVGHNDLVYEDVLTVLTAQPKIEQFDEMKEIHSGGEPRQTIVTTNMTH